MTPLALVALLACGGECDVLLDAAVFDQDNQVNGRIALGVDTFEPPESNLGQGDYAPLGEPLSTGLANTNASTGLGFPAGLSLADLTIQSSSGGGLAAVGPAFITASPPRPPTVMVGADLFADATDLLFTAREAPVAVGLRVLVAFGGTIDLTVFSDDDVELLSHSMSIPVGPPVFVGVTCHAPIRRIRIAGPGGELVDNISPWLPGAPGCTGDCGATDGVVDTVDFLALLAQWGSTGTSCDFDGNGVDTVDFLALLAAWGPCR